MTERHKEISDDIITRLKSTTTLDKYELRKIGGEVYEVLDWLTKGEILNEQKNGYTKGQNFYKYKGLDNLLNPPEPNEPKKDKLDQAYKIAAIISSIGVLVLMTIAIVQENKYNKLSRKFEKIELTNDSLTIQTKLRDSIIERNDNERQQILLKLDSATTKLKTHGKEK